MKILWVMALLVGATLAACGKGGPATSGTPADSAAARPVVAEGGRAQLDSGNAAYRAKDYTGALAHYRAAVESQPRSPAAWFGVYMAQTALGNKAAADSAMNQARTLDPGMGGGHPTGGEGMEGGALPPGHPRTTPQTLPPGHPTTSPR